MLPNKYLDRAELDALQASFAGRVQVIETGVVSAQRAHAFDGCQASNRRKAAAAKKKRASEALIPSLPEQGG